MNKSESVKELAAALAKAQGEFEPAIFDCRNPHFGNEYASFTSVMQSVRKSLSKNGLSITQIQSSAHMLETTLLHASGEWISGETPLIVDKQNMQGLGSAITYAKRYAVSAMLGVVSDADDDANAASGKTEPKKAEPSKATPAIRNVTLPKQNVAALTSGDNFL